MTMYREQFQENLSLPDFMQRFGTEDHCVTALEYVCWLDDGLRCPQCEGARHSVLKGCEQDISVWSWSPSEFVDSWDPTATD